MYENNGDHTHDTNVLKLNMFKDALEIHLLATD